MADYTCIIEGCAKKRTGRGLCPMHYRRAKIAGEFMPGPIPPGTRFWAKVDKSSDCWEWTGGVTGSGYGYFSPARSKMVRAHRYSFELAYGTIPEGTEIDHTCDSRTCVNPEHLRAISHKQNGEHRVSSNSNTPTGFRGVTIKRNKFVARVGHKGRTVYVGTFDTAEKAAEAARAKRLDLFTHSDRDKD
ncbi:HNH endonuclease signature motif containing protein [Brevibacterium oceani]|uniref:HNH endonuclease signature motif containing protein n=1 Tax=Brevibacterium oceani TaxID=358099 RepID=UPI0015E6646D|nr:HNH endonuclease signature motif containing protein [Brevibacterium oceani]